MTDKTLEEKSEFIDEVLVDYWAYVASQRNSVLCGDAKTARNYLQDFKKLIQDQHARIKELEDDR